MALSGPTPFPPLTRWFRCTMSSARPCVCTGRDISEQTVYGCQGIGSSVWLPSEEKHVDNGGWGETVTGRFGMPCLLSHFASAVHCYYQRSRCGALCFSWSVLGCVCMRPPQGCGGPGHRPKVRTPRAPCLGLPHEGICTAMSPPNSAPSTLNDFKAAFFDTSHSRWSTCSRSLATRNDRS